MKKTRVYGPVPSRRFGLSLGVDLLPHKTCCYDCVYCQVGRTTRHTVEREDFFPVSQIVNDVQSAIFSGPKPEVISLAGSGEPTLFRSLGVLIDALHDSCGLPIVLLTNGGLLFKDEVARDALRADVLAPSLDAGDPKLFERVCAPHEAIHFESMLQGLRAVCAAHPLKVRLEVMLVRGINDSQESLRALAEMVQTIRADSIDINTPVRPVPDRSVYPSDEKSLQMAKQLIGSRAEIIATYAGKKAEVVAQNFVEDTILQRILEMLSRRPCTADDIHCALGVDSEKVARLLKRAMSTDRVIERQQAGIAYFFIQPTNRKKDET